MTVAGLAAETDISISKIPSGSVSEPVSVSQPVRHSMLMSIRAMFCFNSMDFRVRERCLLVLTVGRDIASVFYLLLGQCRVMDTLTEVDSIQGASSSRNIPDGAVCLRGFLESISRRVWLHLFHRLVSPILGLSLAKSCVGKPSPFFRKIINYFLINIFRVAVNSPAFNV